MKKILQLLLMSSALLGKSAFAQKPATLTVSWVFTHVVEGYDHKNKCKVWVDDDEVGVSSEKSIHC